MITHLHSLFKAIRTVLYVSSFCISFLNIFYIVYLIKAKKSGTQLKEYVGTFLSKKAIIIICEIIFVLGIISSPLIFTHFENTTIGSFLEKESYNEQYYVYIRSNNKQSKSYRCKADIYRGNYVYPLYTDEGEETFVIQGNGYFLEKVYWNNGGYLTFIDEDCLDDTTSARIYPGKESRCTDLKGTEYYVLLTHEKVKNVNK